MFNDLSDALFDVFSNTEFDAFVEVVDVLFDVVKNVSHNASSNASSCASRKARNNA